MNPFDELKTWLLSFVGREDAHHIFTMTNWVHCNDHDQYALCFGSKALYLKTCYEKEIAPRLIIDSEHLKEVFPLKDHPLLDEYNWREYLACHFDRYAAGVFGFDYRPIPDFFIPAGWPSPWNTLLKSSSLIDQDKEKLLFSNYSSYSGTAIILTLAKFFFTEWRNLGLKNENSVDQNFIDKQIISSQFLEPAIAYLFLNSLDEEVEDGSCTYCDFQFHPSPTDTVELRCRQLVEYLQQPKQRQAISKLFVALISNSK